MTKYAITAAISFSIFLLNANLVTADHGYDRLIVNNTGRCWRIINRDFGNKDNAHSGVSLKIVSVAGTGQTDDQIDYELTIKYDYVDGVGWDETQTQTFTGTGLVKSVANGQVNFEFYVDQGSGTPIAEIQAYYHPGSSDSDADDRIIVGLPIDILTTTVEDPCATVLGEGSGF